MFTKVQKASGETENQQRRGFPSRLLKVKNNLLQTKFSQEIFQRGVTVFCCVCIIVFGITLLSKADPITTSIGQDISTNNLSLSGNITSGTWAGSNIDIAHGGTGQNWSAATQGSFPFFSGTGALSTLTPGTTGQFLQSGGTGANPSWGNATRSATFVIAASNSSTKSKQQADYVCDGTDDQVEIQAAIDALPANGGKVLLLSGNYQTAASIHILKSNDVLEGEGWNSIISMRSGANKDFVIVGNTSDTFSNIVIRNLQINGSGQTSTSNGIFFDTNIKNSSIINCKITNINDVGIKITYGSDGCIIKDNKVDSIVTAINIYACNNTTVSGNEVVSSGGRGISVYPNETTSTPSLNTIITNNIAHGCSTYGIYLYGSHHGIVSNNICYENRHGVALNSSASFESCKHNIITGNYSYNNTENGILLGNSSYGYVISSTISNNICESNGYDGIQVNKSKYSTIENNTCNNNTQNQGVGNRAGIYLTGDNQNTLVTNNICVDNQTVPTQKIGIYNNSGTNNIIAFNVFKNNTVLSFSNGGTNTKITNNQGYLTENSSTSTITTGQTSVTVTHGLATTPTRVQLTPTTSVGSKNYWISAKTATTFTITIDSAHTSDITFDWRGVVGEGN